VSRSTTYERACWKYAGKPSLIGSVELAALTSASVPISMVPPKPPFVFGQRKPIDPAVTSVSQSRTAPPIERRSRVRREMPWTGSWRSERRACGVSAWGLSAGARW